VRYRREARSVGEGFINTMARHAGIVALSPPVKRRAARRFTSRSNLEITTGRTGPCTEDHRRGVTRRRSLTIRIVNSAVL